MDFNEINKKIDDSKINFYMCTKNKNEYACYNRKISQEIENFIKNTIKDCLDRYSKMNILTYNIVGSLDNTLEKDSTENYPVIDSFFKKICLPGLMDDLKKIKINFYVYELIMGKGKKIYFFKQNKNLKIFKSGMVAKLLLKDSLEKIDINNSIAIEPGIDIIIFDKEIIIKNHSAFEKIFGLYEIFKEEAEKIFENKKLEEIVGFEKLKVDVLDNLNFVKRIAKLEKKQNKFLFLDKPEKTKQVIKDFKLGITFNKENKIIYDNKSQAADFINLMQDAYYKTIIGEDRGTDERR
ncbi:protein of unknown function [Peptostreptococcus russellii]|uniref:DUF4868 domain-containing protein n=1 Tax=Peptostreptococcus russellii TaxID=215200 RepID=A0A1H8KGL0_9FIRM|nr:Kiwa anti-phage protein KwaB-like domain-containing protein [Peptostreptococcus russellii]SEN92110.1 protein of unknown function [Peptostreptococcus russellii]